jgi:hypothetical protein
MPTPIASYGVRSQSVTISPFGVVDEVHQIE